MIKGNIPFIGKEMVLQSTITLQLLKHNLYNIYILGVFTEKPYSKSLERNVQV